MSSRNISRISDLIFGNDATAFTGHLSSCCFISRKYVLENVRLKACQTRMKGQPGCLREHGLFSIGNIRIAHSNLHRSEYDLHLDRTKWVERGLNVHIP